MVTAIKIVSNCNNDLYLNIYKLLTNFLTLSVTPFEAERPFSVSQKDKNEKARYCYSRLCEMQWPNNGNFWSDDYRTIYLHSING